ncbi:MAG: hypothetical protein DSY37_04220, partial [Hyperthermus sp.]
MITLRVEMSKSRSGKHAVRSMVFLVSERGEVYEAKPRTYIKTKPIYAKGTAYEASYVVPENMLIVYVWLTKNLRGHVKGYMEVYSRDAELLFRAAYRKLKLRYSKGDPSYEWAVRRVA